MQTARRLLQTVLNAADFPGEVLTGVPVVEIHGDTEAVILNHRGVLAYDGIRIRLASTLGPVTVLGENLEIFRMNRERVVIHGAIHTLLLGEAEL